MKQELIVGRKIVIEALERRDPIEKVFVLNTLRGEDEIAIRRLCQEQLVPLKQVPSQKLNQLSRANHQGVIALSSAIRYQDIEDIIPFLYENGKIPRIALLDRVTDIRNLGAIARSAEIFGIHAIVYTAKKSAEINAHSIKASAGALLTIPVCRVQNLQDAISYLQANGLVICASSLEATGSISEMDFLGPCAVIIGSEDQGISREVSKMSDHLFKIPQIGGTESLNASVAAGICFYEIMQQRSHHI